MMTQEAHSSSSQVGLTLAVDSQVSLSLGF